MLVLLHGPAIDASRQKLQQIKKDFKAENVIVFEKGSDPQTILAYLMTPSLLSEEKLIVLENPPEDFTNYPLPTTNYQLILWFDREVDEKKPALAWAKKVGQVLYFPPEKEVSVFPFLDLLGSRDKKAYLELDKLKKSGADAQYLITMMLYQLRSLVVTKKDAKSFVKEKASQQRKNFTPEELVSLYKFVLETDFKIKSGLIDSSQAEFLIVNKFLT